MTYLVNSPTGFATEAVRGFVAANRCYVREVQGGVVRSTRSPRTQVALVLGGGSGHFPAFAGWVGRGMAHGAACGNVFASPSAAGIYSVARAAACDGGVLLGFGNYAGDVINFGLAAERLRADGLDVRIVTVSDDIASARSTEHEQRRGIAGDLLVFKIAGAAADSGLDLDDVERIAKRANSRTRSLGVAFAGTTLPGAESPLFTIPDRTMAIGLGIHGEPGISEMPLGNAAAVADLLVDGVLGEEPERGSDGYEGRVAVLLNGLGATKYEELFVVYDRVSGRLAHAGLTVVEPEVGEHVTSLDMAGLSLTLTFLDSELETYWTAPVDTATFRRGSLAGLPRRTDLLDAPETVEIAIGSTASQALAANIVTALRAMARTVVESEKRWGDLDAVAGDGDHGLGMTLGVTGALGAAEEAAAAGAGSRTVLMRAGDAWADNAGGTSGALWGAALGAAGGALSDESGATGEEMVEAVQRGVDAVLRLGGAQPGDKTMIDAMIPFAETLGSALGSSGSIREAWTQAAVVARSAADATASMTAKRGRSRTHGEHSLGHPDPGALSFAVLMAAVAESCDPPARHGAR